MRKEREAQGAAVYSGESFRLPGPTRCDVRGSYRDAFFRPEDFFIRTAAFFPGFFLAAFAMIPPPFK
jgi:hypothetical protein